MRNSFRCASFIRRVVQSGYVRDEARPVEIRDGRRYVTYLQKSLPPLEFEYTKAQIQDEVHRLDSESQENLPMGVDGSLYVVAGLGLNYQQNGKTILAPIRTGVGLRAGANIGYLHYTKEFSLLPM